jgi:hypothetical protein
MPTTTRRITPVSEAYADSMELQEGPPQLIEYKKEKPWWGAGGPLDKLYESRASQGFCLVALFWALFAVDCFDMAMSSDATNTGLYVSLLFTMIVFVAEIVICSLTKPQYLGSFFCNMDVLGTISLVFDIPWISPMSDESNSTLLRASRTTRIGARATRLTKLIRLIKIVRVVRVAKLFKFFYKINPEQEKDEVFQSASKISRKLGELVSKRVAALVMLMVITMPFAMYEEMDGSLAISLRQFDNMVTRGLTPNKVDVDSFFDFYDGALVRPQSLMVGEMTYLPPDEWKGNANRDSFNVELSGENSTIVVNIAERIHNEGVLNFILIWLVIVLLIGFSQTINKKIDDTVMVPFERIFTAVRNAVGDVMSAAKKMGGEGGDGEDDEMGALESAVGKLSMLGEHVTAASTGKQTKAMTEVMDSELDDKEKEWLQSHYHGDGQGTAASKEIAKKPHPSDLISKRKMSFMAFHARITMYTDRPTDGHHEQDMHALTGKLDFDVLSYKIPDLFPVVHWLLVSSHCMSDFNLDEAVLYRFVKKLSDTYNDMPYHNFRHGVDAMQTMYVITRMTKCETLLSQVEILAALVGALGHDTAHPGVNNQFLINTKDKLAMVYNDTSVLENMHVSKLYEILLTEGCELLGPLSSQQWAECRKAVVFSVLATDMAHHFKMVHDTEIFYEVNETKLQDPAGRQELFGMPNNSRMLLELFMHMCDISNAVKETRQCKQWAQFVVDEFFAQGDKEAEQGMPISPMFDRTTTNIPSMQCGFMEFICAPLFVPVVKIFPELHILGFNLCNNRKYWGRQWISGVFADDGLQKGREEGAKNKARLKGLEAKFEFSQRVGDRIATARLVETTTVEVQILGATAIVAEPAEGDSYCVLFSEGLEVGRTSTVKASSAADWRGDEASTFTVVSMNSTTVHSPRAHNTRLVFAGRLTRYSGTDGSVCGRQPDRHVSSRGAFRGEHSGHASIRTGRGDGEGGRERHRDGQAGTSVRLKGASLPCRIHSPS